MSARTSWRWKRLAISAFVAIHVAALILWNLPNSATRARAFAWTTRYLYPLGLWQNWAMFAPDPVRHTLTLDAMAVDRNGIIYTYEFPKMADFSLVGRAARVRHAKFASYFGSDEFMAHREVAARHVIRRLDVPAEAYPVDVDLQFQVRETPPFGTTPDPMTIPRTHPIKGFRFDTPEEVRP